MTQNTAIICETNPFHNGHNSLFAKVKQEFGGIITAVMSGNFVQRGLPAVYDKYFRASVLLQHGADLVVELPYPWCAAGGEAFAAGGVAVAVGMGADNLAFGSETGEIQMLTDCASFLDREDTGMQIREMEKNEPEAGAAMLYDRLCKEAGFVLGANDKLAVWYLRQIEAQKAGLFPVPCKRVPYGEGVASASMLRQMLDRGENLDPYVPSAAAASYTGCRHVSAAKFEELAWTYFRLFAPDTPRDYGEKSGLYRRLCKEAGGCTDPASFFASAATKKYTDARIRRTCLLAMTETPIPKGNVLPQYTVLLAAGEKGRQYLSRRRRHSDFPVVTKPADVEKLSSEAAEQYAWQIRADRLYTMCMEPTADSDLFLRSHPVIEK